MTFSLVFSSVDNFVLMLILTLLNGFSVGCIFATQENAIQFLWSSKQIGIRTQIIVSMFVSGAVMSYIALSSDYLYSFLFTFFLVFNISKTKCLEIIKL